MNLHGVGFLQGNRILILTHTTGPNVRFAITPDPQDGPAAAPSVIVLNCAQVFPYFPAVVTGRVITAGRELYASGPVRGKPGRWAAISVRDYGLVLSGGLFYVDAAAVRFSWGKPTGLKCGAGSLTLATLKSGNFVSEPLW
jgi:hypothetical protein